MTDLWSEAIEEARASAPADVFEIETIEILHPEFRDEEDQPDSIRGVLDTRAWDLELEPDAPLKGGETVTFDPIGFRVERPAQEAGTLGEVRLAFDNVPRTHMPLLDEAVKVRATAELIVRSWVAVRDGETGVYAAEGPPGEVLRGLTIRGVRITGRTVTATARFLDLLNLGFPRRIFTREEFPALFGGEIAV